MTALDQAIKTSYPTNGTSSSFTFPYYFIEQSHLYVYDIDASNVKTEYTLGTHYDISGTKVDGVYKNGANVVFKPAYIPPTSRNLYIKRITPKNQQTIYENNSDFPAQVYEVSLDKLTLLVQELNEKVERCLKLNSESSINTDIDVTPDALQVFRINSDGDAVEFIDASILGVGGGGSGTGDVVGPAGAVQYILPVYADTSGKVLSSISSIGTSGQILTSNGAGNKPSFQTLSISIPDASESTKGLVLLADEAEVVTGTDTTKAATSAGVAAAIAAASGVLTHAYESTEQTITSAGSLTLPHSLPSPPKLIQYALVCKTAEVGYSINDVLDIQAGYPGSAGSANKGLGVTYDATNINIRFGGGGGSTEVFSIPHKTTGIFTALTNANWKLIVRAWS